MKKLLALTALLALCAGCKLPHSAAICPEYYAQQVTALNAQWHAGKITTTEATTCRADLDASVELWLDDHFVSDAQRALIVAARQ